MKQGSQLSVRSSSSIEKYKSRRIRVAIRHVLMEKWDPIGVADEPMAWDEYDRYIGGVFELLQENGSREAIEIYLRNIEVQRMGLVDGSGEPLMPIAKRVEAAGQLQQVFHQQMLID